MSTEVRIDKTHPDVDAMSDRWARARAFAEGGDAVKAGAQKFLPRPQGLSGDGYTEYLERAEVPGAVGRTITGLTGLVFSKPLDVVVPKRAHHF